MTGSRPGYPHLVSAALGLVASVAAIAVAQTPVPRGAVGSSAMTRDDIVLQTPELIQTLVTDYYPAVIRGASPINRITFVLDAAGNYVTSAAWTDTAIVRRSMSTTTAVAGVPFAQSIGEMRAVIGVGGGGDFGAVGFPSITRDAVMTTQSARRHTPNPLWVFIIRLKK